MSFGRSLLSLALLRIVVGEPLPAADGQFDPGFSQDGWTVVDFNVQPELNDYASGVTALPDGRIVSAGEAYGTNSGLHVAVSRHRADGFGDGSFSDDGRLLFQFEPTVWSKANQVLLLPDPGSVVVVGTTLANPAPGVGLALLLEDGSFDPAFGAAMTPGRIAHDLPEGDLEEITAAAIHGAGRILVAGTATRSGGQGRDGFVVRYLANGVLDTFFGDDGIAWIAFDQGGFDDDEVTSLAVDDAGRIVVLVRVETDDATNDEDTGIARLEPTGDPDAQFGGLGGLPSGLALFQLTDVLGATQDNPAAIAVQPDGRIVFAGWNSAATNEYRCYVGRLLESGAADPTLAARIFDIAGEELVLCRSLTLQSDGRLLLSGTAGAGCFAVRLEPDGQAFDLTFGEGGIALLPPPVDSQTACGAAALSGGRLVLAGSRYVDTGGDDFYIARLSSELVFRDGFESGSRSQWSGSGG